jgi:hypothetical protein
MGLRRFWRVSDRAKLPLRVVAVMALAGIACVAPGGAPTPCYEVSSQRLVRLDADTRRDGFIDQRTYLDGNIPFRTEADTDRDGRIDRWEYVDTSARVVKVGASSQNDGIEDQWVYPAGAEGEQRVERSTERTLRVDRREFYRAEVLVRTEEDTNQDGLSDKWEVFEGGVLREVAFDTTRSRGRPDRRLIYDAQGRYVRFEADTRN